MTPLVLPAWLVLLISLLASARLWRLLTVDGITFPARKAWSVLIGKIGGSEDGTARRQLATELDEGFYCSFCSGFWIALGVLFTALAWHDTIAWQLGMGALAINWLAGHANSRIEADDFDPAEPDFDE